MATAKDDLFNTLLDITRSAHPRHVSEAFAKAVRDGQAECDSEFEGEDFKCAECDEPVTSLRDGDYCEDCADTVRAEAFRDNDFEPSDAAPEMNAEVEALQKELLRMKSLRDRYLAALEEIYDRAEDCYDGPEDRTHGPYLSLAGEALGVHP